VKTKIMAVAVALGLALGLGLGPQNVGAEELKGLRGQAVTAPDKAPEAYKVQDGVKHERAYPHQTDKYEIDLKVNQCLRCHEWPYSDQEKAPKISDLHYIDRNGVRQDTVNGNRYVCTQCHVPQVDAKPLVENKFQPAVTNR